MSMYSRRRQRCYFFGARIPDGKSPSRCPATTSQSRSSAYGQCKLYRSTASFACCVLSLLLLRTPPTSRRRFPPRSRDAIRRPQLRRCIWRNPKAIRDRGADASHSISRPAQTAQRTGPETQPGAGVCCFLDARSLRGTPLTRTGVTKAGLLGGIRVLRCKVAHSGTRVSSRVPRFPYTVARHRRFQTKTWDTEEMQSLPRDKLVDCKLPQAAPFSADGPTSNRKLWHGNK